MLQTEVNIQIGKKEPNDYMKSIIDQCNGQENKYGAINTLDDLYKNMEENCIPKEIVTMTVKDYEKFLMERRKLMAKLIEKYYKSL